MAELKRALGFWTILALSFSSILGTGMFFSVSIGSAISGNGVILAWFGLTILATYISMFFAELAAMYPKAGGLYEFSKHAYNRFISFMMGWVTWFVGNVTVALMVVAAIDYLLPGDSSNLLKIVISISFIILLNIIAFYGVEASALMLVFFSIITLVILFSVMIPGSVELQSSHFKPFMDPTLGITAAVSAILVTVFFLSESFFGWESVTFLAEETKNPEKVIPRALILGTIVVGLLGTGTSIVALGIIPASELAASDAPLSEVVKNLFPIAFQKLFDIGVFVTLVGTAAGGIVSMPRLILALSRDKLFITQFAAIHPIYQTPYKAIIFQTIVSIIVFFMAFGQYQLLLGLSLPLGFILYAFTLFIVFKLRIHKPHLHRPFKAPLAVIGSLALVGFMCSLMAVWLIQDPGAVKTLQLSLSFISLGVPIYLLLMFYYDPEVIVKLTNKLAYLSLIVESFVLPKQVRKTILSLLGDVHGKTVLEYGCSVGTLTKDLAHHVLPKGMLYATDISAQAVTITQKRMTKRGYYHTVILHDEHQVNRIHPNIPSVDAVVSVGMLGYIQDVKKVLKEIKSLMPYGSKVVFVDYVDFFGIIPNVQWLGKNKSIEELFRECGFSVFVKREKGLFWNYVYVYGIKFYDDIVYV